MTFPDDCVLQPGSLMLVTGANGFVGSHVADQLLTYGYRVRGTVRNKEKNGWMTSVFNEKHGDGKFELFEVAELDDFEKFKAAAHDCDGIVHVASPVGKTSNPHEVIAPAIDCTLAALKAAAATPTVKRFVFTSSSAAARTHGDVGRAVQITPESWNDAALENVWAPPPYGQDRLLASYMASKVLAEREVWTFMTEHKPHFVANAVLPGFVTGKPISVEHQGLDNLTVMLLKTLVDQGILWQFVGPGYMVDAADTARLHVAAMLKPDVQNERVFGLAHEKTWTSWIAILRKHYPEHTFPDPPPNEGRDEATITARDRAEGMLQWLGQPGWRLMEESVVEAVSVMV